MKEFVVNYHDRRQSGIAIYLESDGNVCYAEWEHEGSVSGRPDDEPDYRRSSRTPYGAFLSTLDAVAKTYPEVYRAVYEHIQSKTEDEYVRLARYCKEKNNEYARKFKIIN